VRREACGVRVRREEVKVEVENNCQLPTANLKMSEVRG